MGPLRLGRIRGDRIADMDMYARLRRGGDLQRHRRSGRVPPRVRQSLLIGAVGHLAD